MTVQPENLKKGDTFVFDYKGDMVSKKIGEDMVMAHFHWKTQRLKMSLIL